MSELIASEPGLTAATALQKSEEKQARAMEVIINNQNVAREFQARQKEIEALQVCQLCILCRLCNMLLRGAP